MKRITLALVITAGLMASAAMAQSSVKTPASPTALRGNELDLSEAFHTRSAWRFTVTEGPPAKDFSDDSAAPGVLTLCLRKSASGPCISDPVTPPLPYASMPDRWPGWAPHYLIAVKPVYPHGQNSAPLLLIITGSLHSGDGDQVIATQLLSYDPFQDAFR